MTSFPRCGKEGHLVRECPEEPKTRVVENEDGTKREIYVPKELEEGHLFEQGINTGINFDKFDHIPVRVHEETLFRGGEGVIFGPLVKRRKTLFFD